jgi:hypothetical protein
MRRAWGGHGPRGGGLKGERSLSTSQQAFSRPQSSHGLDGQAVWVEFLGVTVEDDDVSAAQVAEECG